MTNYTDNIGGGGRERSQQRAVSVFTAHDELEGELIKNLLAGCGIECVIQGRMVPGIYANMMGDMGGREVFVLEEDVEDARELLAGWHENSLLADDESE